MIDGRRGTRDTRHHKTSQNRKKGIRRDMGNKIEKGDKIGRVREQLACGKCIQCTIREEKKGREERENRRERRYRREERREKRAE